MIAFLSLSFWNHLGRLDLHYVFLLLLFVISVSQPSIKSSPVLIFSAAIPRLFVCLALSILLLMYVDFQGLFLPTNRCLIITKPFNLALDGCLVFQILGSW